MGWIAWNYHSYWSRSSCWSRSFCLKTCLFFTEKTNAYFRLKPRVVRFIEKTLPITATKTKPTEKDYERGYYTRYFCKRNNAENLYLEIDKSTFNNLKSKNDKHDFHLYTADSLIWAIDGDIIKANNTTLQIISKKYPNISSLFVKLNEFQKIRIAEKGELTYEDGTEYMGYYHLHLGKPMEGLYHEPKPHKKLLFVGAPKINVCGFINFFFLKKNVPSGPKFSS